MRRAVVGDGVEVGVGGRAGRRGVGMGPVTSVGLVTIG